MDCLIICSSSFVLMAFACLLTDTVFKLYWKSLSFLFSVSILAIWFSKTTAKYICLIHFSNLWICVISHVCLWMWYVICRGDVTDCCKKNY